jgi:tol-pal system protein YbgF
MILKSGRARYVILICAVFFLSACSNVRFQRPDPPSNADRTEETMTASHDPVCHAQLEQTQHDLNKKERTILHLQDQVKALEQKLAALEQDDPLPLSDTSRTPWIDEVTPDQFYQEARTLMQAGDLTGAATLFRTFVQRHPDHRLADNALYWLGECHYSLGDFPGAVDVFKELVATYPGREKVPDALLKTGYSYLNMDDVKQARHYLKQVLTTYPFSDAADKAQEKLILSD